MSDGSASCDENTWKNNTFETDLVVGSPDGGPGGKGVSNELKAGDLFPAPEASNQVGWVTTHPTTDVSSNQ